MPKNGEQETEVRSYATRLQNLVDEFKTNIHEQLNEDYQRSTSWSDRLADRVASYVGSWRFINTFILILVIWIVLNTLSVTRIVHFDEPPFILLNLLLSCLAGFQAPIIMMSQNRQSAKDKEEAIIDFAINYNAEKEIDDMQGHLHRLEADFAEFRNEVRSELTEIKALLRQK